MCAGCSVKLATKSDAYPFPSENIFDVIPGTTFSVNNAYKEPNKVKLDRGVYCDAKQLTDTAVTIVERELSKKGLKSRSGASKEITLKVIDPSWTHGLVKQTGRFTLEATLGNGETLSVVGSHTTAGNGFRAFNGAMLNATDTLLQDARLANYLKGP